MNTDHDYLGGYRAFWPTTATQRALWVERFWLRCKADAERRRDGDDKP